MSNENMTAPADVLLVMKAANALRHYVDGKFPRIDAAIAATKAGTQDNVEAIAAAREFADYPHRTCGLHAIEFHGMLRTALRAVGGEA